MKESFRPRERIRKKKDFLFLYRKGARYRGKYFNLIYYENEEGYSRLGVVVSRKIGQAVTRNRIKRWLRELFRRNKELISGSLDLLFVATPAIAGATWNELREEYFQALRKISRRENCR